jgi:alcohol dehydrogenase
VLVRSSWRADQHTIDINSATRQWMYPPQANTRLVELACAGLLDLNHFDVTEFALDDANKAITHAADSNGRFTLTVIRP